MAADSRPPCASCKQLRRRCTADCVFAPYFPVEDRQRFDTVHRIYGSSNVARMLQELPAGQRADAVSSLVYEANARKRDPVYGCAGAIYSLQHQIVRLQMQLAVARAQLLHHHRSLPPSPLTQQQHLLDQQQQNKHKIEMPSTFSFNDDDVLTPHLDDQSPAENSMLLLQGGSLRLNKQSLWTPSL